MMDVAYRSTSDGRRVSRFPNPTRSAGVEPQVIEYFTNTPDRATRGPLLARMNIRLRDWLREKGLA